MFLDSILLFLLIEVKYSPHSYSNDNLSYKYFYLLC